MNQTPFSFRGFPEAWNRFFHETPDVRICGLIRVLYGVLVTINFAAAYPFVEMWWSEDGFLPYKASRMSIDSDTWTLFEHLPKTNEVLWLCYWIALIHCILLTIGFLSRINAAAVFFWLVVFHHRNNLITDGEDIVFRLFGFLLIFMPLWQRFSLDAWIRRKWFPLKEPWQGSGWSLRLLQIFMCVILWSAGLEKLGGGNWWNGHALYYVMRLDDFFPHLPMPQFVVDNLVIVRLMTWVALYTETLAPILIWFKETRRIALIAIVLLHFGIQYMMNLFLFQYIMLVGWISHMHWEELKAVVRLPKRLLTRLKKGDAEVGPVAASE